jgi:hypothetical protein
MNLTVKLTSKVIKSPTPEWQGLRDAKIQEMVQAGKTDGVFVQTSSDYTFARFFVDAAAAQEYLDWLESTNSGYAINSAITQI